MTHMPNTSSNNEASALADKYYSLMASVECVLMDHLDALSGPNVDANLAELGYDWQQLTSLGGPQDIQAALARNNKKTAKDEG